jgi:high affinity Mn2+ porin
MLGPAFTAFVWALITSQGMVAIRLKAGFCARPFNLQGETEKLEPDRNQFAGTQTANRLVFTIDKYSIVDIFDTNIYAHDPRNDFLD